MAHLLSNIVSDRLTRLNGATFQSLCDEYLCYKFYNHIRVFDREGSQRVKDKTIAGTPDTLFILDDDSDMLYIQKDHFIKTDTYKGLSEENVQQAIQILNK